MNGPRFLRDRRHPVARLLIPQYNEVTLFLMGLSFVLLLVSEAPLRDLMYRHLMDRFDLRNYLFLGLLLIGIMFSVYHVFTVRPKTTVEKHSMLFFAVMVNGMSGIAAGIHLLKDSHGLLLVFPLWNILSGVLLLLLYRLRFIGEDAVTDDDASRLSVIVGVIVVTAVFAACHFHFHMYWAVTFSICVAYATSLNDIIQKTFSGSRA